MSKGLTQKDAATRLGISAATLRRLTKAGVVPRNDDGTYPWRQTRKAFNARNAPERKGITQREAAERIQVTTKWLRTLTSRGEVPRNDDGSYP